MQTFARQGVLFAGVFLMACMPRLGFGQSPGPGQLGPPSGLNLKLLRVERKPVEPAQAWVEFGSFVRRGTNAEAWLLQILASDRQTPRGPIVGMWTKLQVDCQNLSTNLTHQAEIQSSGQVSQTVALPVRPPSTTRAGTIGARVVDVVCSPQAQNTIFANSLAQAIQMTRRPIATSSIVGAAGQQVTNALPSGPRFVTLRECSFRYSTLAQAANLRRRANELSDADRVSLEATEKAYDLRGKELFPDDPQRIATTNEVLARIAALMRAPRSEVQVELNKLKVLGAQCDNQLGNQALPLP